MAAFVIACALGDAPLPSQLADALQTVVSQAGPTRLSASARVVLASAELGLWPSSGRREAGGGEMAVVAGDPVACRDDKGLGRERSIDHLAQALATADMDALAHCEGTFCAVWMDPADGSMALAVDKLAVRPLYVARHGDVLYGASAIWMLEALPVLPKRCDWLGITETAAFGYPLSDRTPYEGIEALAPGTLLRVSAGQETRSRYWNWADTRSLAMQPGTDPVERVERAFHQAVQDRMVGGSQALAFLSGGMDSRYIAATLRGHGVRLHTLNFAPQGSADLVFGGLAARAMGTAHLEFGGGDAPFAQRKREAIECWRAQLTGEDAAAAGDLRVLWSGDGGSVVLGHVYLDDETVQVARGQGLEAAARVMQRRNRYHVPPRLFTPAFRHLADWPLQAITQQLQALHGHEPGRATHLFYVLNDQRRHLVGHFEAVHTMGHDLHLPFFDGRFMQAVLSSPVDLFVGHRLYNRLFERLPFGLGLVPWQAYPGHEPCPVSYPGELRRQWSDGWFDAATERRHRRARATELLRQVWRAAFPGQVLARGNLSLGLALTGLGLRDYSYLSGSAQPYLHATRVARGQA